MIELPHSVGNKLYDIKPNIGSSQSVVRNVRLEEVVLARIRIGHTRITHSYLLNREEQPQCVGSDKSFTIRHILLECIDFSNVRNKYYHGDIIKQLFNDVPIDTIFLLSKEINFFNKFELHVCKNHLYFNLCYIISPVSTVQPRACTLI